MTLVADPVSLELAQGLQQWNSGGQSAQQALIRTAVTIADETADVRAQTMAAWAFAHSGDWSRAAEFARRALGSGNIQVAQWIASNLSGQGDANLRRAGFELHRAIAETGTPVDFPNLAHQFASVGDVELAAEMLDELAAVKPDAARARWVELITEIEARTREISDAAAGVATERERVLREMDDDRQHIRTQRADVERLVAEVGSLANKAGGLALANDYGTRANRIEKRSNWATGIAIGLAVLIAMLAVVLAFDAGKDADPLKSALQKAPITIPFLLLNIYIARLASSFRDEAIKLRHIELQIRTANPFLGALDPERRQAVLAMLALRFFPGQEVAGSGKSPSEPTDPGQAFAALLAGHGSPAAHVASTALPGADAQRPSQ